MRKTKPWYRSNLLGWTIGIAGAVIGLLVFPLSARDRNQVAEMELEKLAGVWFVPSGKTDDEVAWLDSENIKPLYKLLTSKSVEASPSKWKYVGKVGFTDPNGRFAAVELFDTKTQRGAFRCGTTYFRYDGGVPPCIEDER